MILERITNPVALKAAHHIDRLTRESMQTCEAIMERAEKDCADIHAAAQAQVRNLLQTVVNNTDVPAELMTSQEHGIPRLDLRYLKKFDLAFIYTDGGDVAEATVEAAFNQ